MANAHVNGVRLHYERTEDGTPPLVLVHGSWDSHHDWDAVVPTLAESFGVLTYDRRGHSASERPAGQGSVREDVADLAALMEHVGMAPAWVVGNSFGGSIALRLAAQHGDMVLGVIAHEPPLFGLIADDPAMAAGLEEEEAAMAGVVERIESDDHAGAAEAFIEAVLGPGAWSQFPRDAKETMIENAPTFLDEARDPEQEAFDPAWLAAFHRPVMLSLGSESPSRYRAIVTRLATALPHAEVVEFRGAGHVPHVTHPEDFVETTRAFILGSES